MHQASCSLLQCARELLLEQWHLASATETRALSISSHWPEASQGQKPVLPAIMYIVWQKLATLAEWMQA